MVKLKLKLSCPLLAHAERAARGAAWRSCTPPQSRPHEAFSGGGDGIGGDHFKVKTLKIAEVVAVVEALELGSSSAFDVVLSEVCWRVSELALELLLLLR